MTNNNAGCKLLRLLSIFLSLACVTLIFVIFMINNKNKNIIAGYVSKCDRLAIVQLDGLIIKDGIPPPSVSIRGNFVEYIERFKYTDSSILLKYNLMIDGEKLILVDDHGESVAEVDNFGKRKRLRGIGNLENFH